MDLSNIYNKIHTLGITMLNTNNDISAMSIVIKEKYGIFLNYKKFKDSNEEFDVLAHEYGHCKSGTLHKLYSKFDLIEKHERIADQTSIEEFLPVEKIQKALEDGCKYTHEIADYLNMPEAFIIKAIKIYRLTGDL